MPISKRHHVVPKFLLKNFVDMNGQIHLADSRNMKKGIVPKSPEKAFVYFHAYNKRNGDGSFDSGVEIALSRIEDKAAPIIERIIDASKYGLLTNVTSLEKEILNEFTVSQFKRSPDSITKVSKKFDVEAEYRENLYFFDKNIRSISNIEREYFLRSETVGRITRNAQIETSLGMSEEVADAMRHTGLLVVKIVHPRRSFITGSNPVVKMTKPGDTMLGSVNVELWFAVSSQVALVRCGPPAYRHIDIEDSRLIRNTNLGVAIQSTIVGGGAEALVKSITSHWKF